MGDAAGAVDASLAALYREHADDITRYVARRVPASEVDDICQEVWLAAREALPRYRNQCSPRIWLRVLARNKVVDLWRRKPELRTTLSSAMSVMPEVAGMFGAKPPTTPSGKLARAEASHALSLALSALDETDREMLALRFLDGLKPADIALVVGIKANTVSQRIVRAVKRLRELLEG